MSNREADGCPLCSSEGETIIWEDESWRVIRVLDDDMPAYYRLIPRTHVREFSELPQAERLRCAEALAVVESAIISTVRPTSINLASLGNRVPHLHWHVVARFEWDARYPGSPWEPVLRLAAPAVLADLNAAIPEIDAQIRVGLSIGDQ